MQLPVLYLLFCFCIRSFIDNWYCDALQCVYCEMFSGGGVEGWTLSYNFMVGRLEMLYNVIQGGWVKVANVCITQ